MRARAPRTPRAARRPIRRRCAARPRHGRAPRRPRSGARGRRRTAPVPAPTRRRSAARTSGGGPAGRSRIVARKRGIGGVPFRSGARCTKIIGRRRARRDGVATPSCYTPRRWTAGRTPRSSSPGCCWRSRRWSRSRASSTCRTRSSSSSAASRSASIPGMPDIQLDPELVLLIFLPPLLYGAAFFASLRDLRRNVGPISAALGRPRAGHLRRRGGRRPRGRPRHVVGGRVRARRDRLPDRPGRGDGDRRAARASRAGSSSWSRASR